MVWGEKETSVIVRACSNI